MLYDVAFQSPPFVMKKENFTGTDSRLPYEGFCIDLLNELREKLQFEYDIKVRENLGKKQEDGSWDGIIGELEREVKILQEDERLCFDRQVMSNKIQDRSTF